MHFQIQRAAVAIAVRYLSPFCCRVASPDDKTPDTRRVNKWAGRKRRTGRRRSSMSWRSWKRWSGRSRVDEPTPMEHRWNCRMHRFVPNRMVCSSAITADEVVSSLVQLSHSWSASSDRCDHPNASRVDRVGSMARHRRFLVFSVTAMMSVAAVRHLAAVVAASHRRSPARMRQRSRNE